MADEDRDEAAATYLSTLRAMENYVGAWQAGADGIDPPNNYAVPKDVIYGVNELKMLLKPKWQDPLTKFMAADDGESGGPIVTMDLAGARLRGVNLRNFDVGWLDSVYLTGIDLRRATLNDSHWECATLNEATFNSDISGRPTPMRHASFREANLRDADLRNVDLSDADLQNADLTGARLDQAILTNAKLLGASYSPQQLSSTVGSSEALTEGAAPAKEC